MLNTANVDSNMQDGTKIMNKPTLNRHERQDIVSTNAGFNSYQQNSLKIKANSFIPMTSNKVSIEEAKNSDLMSNLKMKQNSQNLNPDNDLRLFQDLYNKNSANGTKLYTKNSRKSSRDSRAIKLQENGIKAMGIKFAIAPKTFEENLSNCVPLNDLRELNSKVLKRNFDLSNKQKGKTEKRKLTISPGRKAKDFPNEPCYDKNELIAAFMENCISKNNEKSANNAKFCVTTAKKKRSQSENRNRQLDMKLSNEENDYFTNKLRATIKMNESKNENEVFFSKRKANQQLSSSKTIPQKEGNFKIEKSLSEKKKIYGLNLLNCNGREVQQVSAFNIQDIEMNNLRQTQFEKTSQFGGNEYNPSSANSSVYMSDEYLSCVAQSEKKSKLNCMSGADLNNLFNCTFFPKEPNVKASQISSKPTISPKIVINKKNYVFKEAIDQLSKDKQGSRRIYCNDDAVRKLENPEYNKQTNIYKNKQQEPTSFNPFEVSDNLDVESNNASNSENKHRCNSDIILCTGFLNRVEVNYGSNHGRRSDIAHYSKHGLNITKQYSLDAKSIKSGKVSNSKLSVDTFSNKNSTNNNENSILSYEVTNSGRISDSK